MVFRVFQTPHRSKLHELVFHAAADAFRRAGIDRFEADPVDRTFLSANEARIFLYELRSTDTSYPPDQA